MPATALAAFLEPVIVWRLTLLSPLPCAVYLLFPSAALGAWYWTVGALLDALIPIALTLGLRDHRSVTFASLFAMAGRAKTLAVRQRVIAAQPCWRDVIVMDAARTQTDVAALAVREPAFATAFCPHERIAHGGFGKLDPAHAALPMPVMISTSAFKSSFDMPGITKLFLF